MVGEMNLPLPKIGAVNLRDVAAQYEPGLETLLQQIDSDMSGGTYERGLKVAKTILSKIARGERLSHALIIEASRQTTGLHMAETDLNLGLADGFGLTEEQRAAVAGGARIELGESGLEATFQELWKPRKEMTDAETAGMTRMFRNEAQEKMLNLGFVVLPQLALRTVIVGFEPNDAQLQF